MKWIGRGSIGGSLGGASVSMLALLCACSQREEIAGMQGDTIAFGGVAPVLAEFGAVVGAVRLPSGTILVADRGRSAIRVLREGATVGELGRAGEGPGEFRLLYRMHLCSADTVVAYDFVQGRLHYFSERGFIKQVQNSATPGDGRLPGLYGVGHPHLRPAAGADAGCRTSDHAIDSVWPQRPRH